MKTLEAYLAKHPNPPQWTKQSIQEFWREFVDGDQQLTSTSKRLIEKISKIGLDIDHCLALTPEQLIMKIKYSHASPYAVFFESFISSHTHLPRNAPLRQEIFKLQGWNAFECRERGYLLGMVRAKALRLQWSNKKATPEFLKELHAEALNHGKVTGTCYEIAIDESPGNFRSHAPGRFGVSKSNASPEGLMECIESFQRGENAYALKFAQDAMVFVITGNPEKPGDNKIHIKTQKNLSLQSISNQKTIASIKNKFLSLNSNTEICNFINDCRKTWSLCISGCLLGDTLYQRVDQAFKDYYERLDQLKVSCSEKNAFLGKALRESIKLCIFLERCHPFVDGNCRVVIMQLLPKLLSDLGLGDIYMFEDPNRFDLYSVDQCVEEVINALEHAQEVTCSFASPLTSACNSQFILDLISQDNQRIKYYNKCREEHLKLSPLIEHSKTKCIENALTEQKVLDLFLGYDSASCSWYAYLKNELPEYKLDLKQLYRYMKINQPIYGSGDGLIHDAVKQLAYQSTISTSNLKFIQDIIALPDFDINQKNSAGNTALHLALAYGNLELASFLIVVAKPSMKIKNKDGVTPFDLLKHNLMVDLKISKDEMIEIPDSDYNELSSGLGY